MRRCSLPVLAIGTVLVSSILAGEASAWDAGMAVSEVHAGTLERQKERKTRQERAKERAAEREARRKAKAAKHGGESVASAASSTVTSPTTVPPSPGTAAPALPVAPAVRECGPDEFVQATPQVRRCYSVPGVQLTPTKARTYCESRGTTLDIPLMVSPVELEAFTKVFGRLVGEKVVVRDPLSGALEAVVVFHNGFQRLYYDPKVGWRKHAVAEDEPAHFTCARTVRLEPAVAHAKSGPTKG